MSEQTQQFNTLIFSFLQSNKKEHLILEKWKSLGVGTKKRVLTGVPNRENFKIEWFHFV